ncbi:hypothetical protein LC040_12205 [Bacillus tianshenii]|nr:hypothetical protein LC040_12205 [Bacillus tianshenii]
MYKYNIYLGYKRETGGYHHVGEVSYAYPLQKGDVVLVANELMTQIEKVCDDIGKSKLKYNQQYRIASIHHVLGFDNEVIPDIYLVSEIDYLNTYKD